MKITSKRAELHKAIRNRKLIRAVGAYDAITARLVEEGGFEAVWASSFGICSALGLPDAGIVTMRELLEVGRVLETATKLPVIADCDNGFGSVNNVIRLVREYEQAGIAAVCIEDQSVPKLSSLYKGAHPLISREEFSEKIRAAVAARRDNDFLIIARVEALVAGMGLAEAIKRAKSYAGAGADLIAIHSTSKCSDEITAFTRRWREKTPIMVIPTTYRLTSDQLKTSNIAVVVFANQVLRTVAGSVEQSLKVLSRYFEDAEIHANQMTDLAQVFRLQRLENWQSLGQSTSYNESPSRADSSQL